MTNQVMVDNSLVGKKVITERSAQYGDNLHIVDVIPQEFRHLMAYYPILLTRDEATGQFLCAVVMGFEPGENLYLMDDGWAVKYIPLSVRRRPFSVLPREVADDAGNTMTVPALSIDLDSPRVNEQFGEAMFDEQGNSTAWLQQVDGVMRMLVEGAKLARDLLSKLEELDLVKPLSLGVELINGEKRNMEGLFGIDEEKFYGLSGEQILELHNAGHLASIYSMLASLGQMGNLIHRKNEQLQAQV